MNCRSCNHTHLEMILDLGQHPWCNDFRYPNESVEVKTYPLKLFCCMKCGLAQLDYTVKKEIMFSDHTYVSGTTKTLKNHFRHLAEENIKQFNLGHYDLIVDIGGNDGTQLEQYQELGCGNLMNVESAKNIAQLSADRGILTHAEYFNEEFVDEWFKSQQKPGVRTLMPSRAKLINASGVFFHLEELHSVCRGIRKLLDPEGVFVVQFMYLKDIVDHNAFDAIYHEHLCYYTLDTLQKLLIQYNMRLIDAYHHPIHGGSMMAKFVHNNSYKQPTLRLKELENDAVSLSELVSFGLRVERLKANIFNTLSDLKKEGKKIYGFGSPAKGTTMLNYCGIDNRVLDKLVEVNSLKFGRVSPITNIPITPESQEDLPDYYFVLSWNFFEEIYEKNKHLPVKWILPLPEIKII